MPDSREETIRNDVFRPDETDRQYFERRARELGAKPQQSSAGPAVGTIVERVARAMALNYYQGCYREKFSSQRQLSFVAGPLEVGTEAALRYTEKVAAEHAEQFWPLWVEETNALLEKLLDEFTDTKPTTKDG